MPNSKPTLIDQLEDIRIEVIDLGDSLDDVRRGHIWSNFQKVCEASSREVRKTHTFYIFLGIIKRVLLDYDKSLNEWQWVKKYLSDLLILKLARTCQYWTDNGPCYCFGTYFDDSEEWIVHYIVKSILDNWDKLIWKELTFFEKYYRNEQLDRGNERMQYICCDKPLDYDEESIITVYNCAFFFREGSNVSRDSFQIVHEEIIEEGDDDGRWGMQVKGTIVQIRDEWCV